MGLADLLTPPHRPLVANLLQTLVADPNLLFEHLQRMGRKNSMLVNTYHRSVRNMAVLLKTLFSSTISKDGRPVGEVGEGGGDQMTMGKIMGILHKK